MRLAARGIWLLALSLMCFRGFALTAQEACPEGLLPPKAFVDVYGAVKEIPWELFPNYRQSAPLWDDPLGDYALALATWTIPGKMVMLLKHKRAEVDKIEAYQADLLPCSEALFQSAPRVPPVFLPAANAITDSMEQFVGAGALLTAKISPDDRAKVEQKIKEGKFYLEGKKNPISIGKLVETIERNMLEDEHELGIAPSAGTPHDWSPRFMAEHRKEFFAFKHPMPSKILLALARGDTAHFMMTGHEDALRDWLIAQDVASVAPDAMIRQSYRLAKGDMYVALLTAENVLSEHWRRKDRELLAQTARLKPITHTLGGAGNHFGAWYHLFGTILYGYARGAIASTSMGLVEAGGSYLLSPNSPDRQEDYMNVDGGLIGARLRKDIAKGGWRKRAESSKPGPYLNLGEDFTDQLLDAKKKGQF